MQHEKTRIEWADIAKGISILLVVLWHSTFRANGNMELINSLNEAFIFLRMPLFFFVSGFFIENSINKSWDSILKTKISNLIYLFLIWAIINDIVFDTAPLLIKHGTFNLTNPLIYFIKPPGTLWFLYALAIGLIIMKLVRNLPIPLVLPAFLFLYWFATIDGQWRNVDFFIRVARLIPFMYLGSISFKIINQEIKSYYVYLWPIIFFTPFMFHIVMNTNLSAMPFVTFLTSILGLVVLLSTSFILSGSWVGVILCKIGRNSLYIYVLHRIPVALSKKVLFSINDSFNINLIIGYFLVFLIGLIVPLIVKIFLIKGPLIYLFSQPLAKKHTFKQI